MAVRFCLGPSFLAHSSILYYIPVKRKKLKMEAENMIKSIFECVLEFSEYVFFGAVVLVIIRIIFKNFPRDIFRKLLHLIAFSSLVEMTIVADTWYYAALSSILFATVVYPLLLVFEKKKWYSDLFIEKKNGEVKKSLIELFGMYSALSLFCWGIFKRPDFLCCAVLMWGVGDASASIVGRRLGKHKVDIPFADRNKSIEGSTAMLVSAFASGAVGLLLSGNRVWYEIVFYPLITAPVSAYVELVSKDGRDTYTVPTATAVILIALSYIF